MSEPLYFIFGLPAFESELKNRKLMVNHKIIGLILFGKKFVYFKISTRSRRDLTDHEIQKGVELYGEILPIAARCRKSRRELDRVLRNPQTSR